MLFKLSVRAQRHGPAVNLLLTFYIALHHTERGSVLDDQSFRRRGSIMPLTLQTLSNMGSERPYPGQLWKRDSGPVWARQPLSTLTIDGVARCARLTRASAQFALARHGHRMVTSPNVCQSGSLTRYEAQ